MKKFIFSMICTLLPIFASAQVQNEELTPYAVLSENNTILTFFYDNDKESQGGMDIGPFTSADERGWNEHCESIGHVKFDGSFANYTPTSTSYWFDGFTNLTQIEGLENLNTNNITDMSCMFNGCEKLESLILSGFNTSNVTYMSLMFGGCSSLTSLDVTGFDTSNAIYMDGMFRGCSGLTSLNVSSFNTEKAKEISEMFAGCSGLSSLDFGDNFNTSNVTTMWAMFSGCSSLTSLDVTGFDTSKTTEMGSMFSHCSKLTSLDLSNFNTANVKNMGNMFDGCSIMESLQMDFNNFSTESVTNMGSMFGGCLKLTTLDLSGFNTSNVSDFSHMFASCSGLTSLNVTGFDTSKAENMTSMFSGCSGLTYLDLSHFNTSKVTAMSSMFESCYNLDSLNLSTFDTSNATDLSYMFYGCSRLKNLDISSFNTSNVEEMQYMFYQCNGLETILVGNGWNTGNINAGANMFTECTALVGGEGTTYDANNKDYNYAHIDGGTSNPGYLSGSGQEVPYAVLSVLNEVNGLKLTFYYDDQKAKRSGMTVGPSTSWGQRGWDEQSENIKSVVFDESFENCTTITSTSSWFYNFTNLTTITGLENLITDNVTDMSSMFLDCSKLTSLDVSHFNTSNVTNLYQLFAGCRSLTSLDVSNFDTSNATNLGSMFLGCLSLTELDVTGFDTSNATYLYNMFEDCSSLTTLDVTGFNTSKATSLESMFNGCSGLTSLDLSGFDTSNATGLGYMFYNCENLTSLDLSSFNTSNVTSMRGMFRKCSGLTSLDVSGFDTSNATIMEQMFFGCSSLTNLDLSSFNTSKVTAIGYMFYQCSGLETIHVGNGWSTVSIEDGAEMFTECTALVGGAGTTYDANNVDYHYAHIDKATSDPSDPGYFTGKIPYAVLSEGNTVLTFYCGAQATDNGMSVGPFTTANEREWANQCENIVKVVFDESFADCTSITSTRYWFYGFNNVTEIKGLEYLKTDNVTDMSSMFWNCSSLTSLDVSNFDTSNATALSGMFMDCSNLTELDVTNFNTSSVTTMSSMFSNCSSLTNLDLSSFNTSNVPHMNSMFSQCSGLETIYVGEGWSTESITSQQSGADMFTGCTALIGGAGTTYDDNHINYTYAHIDGGTSNAGYLSGAGQAVPYAVLNEDNTMLIFYYDDQKAKQNGMSVGPFTAAEERGWNEQKENIEKVFFVEEFANCTTITSTRCWFDGFNNLTLFLGLNNLKTDNVTDMAFMFRGCSSLNSLDLSEFNTSKVTSMGMMFWGCSNLTNLTFGENFNTSNVTSMNGMFGECSNLTNLDLSSFNTSNVTDMTITFYGCSNLNSLDLSGFNTSKVISMGMMFWGCSNLTNLTFGENFNTSNVTSMDGMFTDCSSLTSLDVTGFDTSNTTGLSAMFHGCTSLTSLDVTGFDTSNATTLNSMFGQCSNLTNLDLSSFNTSNVTDMQLMFSQCSGLETILVGNGWSTESITSEEAGADMFTECIALRGGAGTEYDANHVDYTYARIDKGEMNPGYLTGPSYEPYAVLSDNNTVLIFYYDDQKEEREGMSVGPFTSTDSREWKDDVTTITYVEFDSSFADCTSITSTARWFDGCSNLTEISGISYLHTENVTSMRRMFKDCSSLTGIDLSHFNTGNVTKMDYMFDGCSGLNKLDVSGFNTGNVTEMGSMFANCSSLKSLDVTGFNTESVTDISRMFYSCSGLTTLDLSNFNTANAKEDLSNLFRNCSSLMTIYVGSGWTTDNMTNGENMFLNCTNLEGGAGTKYDTNHTDHAYAHIDGGTSNPGYLTGPSQPRPYAVLSDNNAVLTFYYDDQKAARGGMDVGPFEQWGGQGTKSGWSDVNEQITTVVFNNSFANFTKLTSTAYWFYGCENLTTITGMSNLKTDNVTDINSMFGDCHSLKSIDFSSLNLSNVTNMHQVFEDCRALESIDFSGVNTENVTNMGDLFLNCKSLKTIDISSFNTKNVTKMTSMFYKCDVLTTIYVGEGWTTENVTESGEMFEKSPNLVGGRGTTYDENHIGIEYAHIDGGTSNPGYLTDINGASEETWAKLQSKIEYGTDVLAKAKEISTIDQALIEKLDEALQNANQMYKIHEASEDEVLHMIEVLNERINDVEEAMNQPASEETWEELKATIEYGTDVLAKAKEISTIDQWLIEELDMTLDSGNQMYKIHEASEEEVLNMIDELNWRIKEVEEAMNQPASDEAWAELNKAVETGEKLQTEAKGVSTVEPWALEELENMTAKGSEMYKVHTAGEEEVRHMTEELNQIINEVEEMMRKQPQGEASFDGLTAYVSGNATLDDAFKSVGGRSEAAKTIAAIVWNADNALTADMLSGIDNPNLLVYVTEASKAPSGVQNVIIDGVASEIVLTDATGNNNFYCPQSFTAKSISYSRDFSQTTEIDVCRGWETIALPFDVQSITHESHGTLVPFGGGDNGHPFWLRQLSTNGLTRATKIEANHPYLLCMPNNIIYPPEYNQNGTVTFSSSNVTVPVTSARSSTSAGVTLHATFLQVTKSSSVYALNVGETRGEYPEGSVFEQNYRDIRPFQAYTTHRASTRSFITLESLGGNDDATGIEELRIKNSEFGDAEGVWYSLDGRRLDAKPTKKGVYVKDGRKIVIK